MADTLQPPIQDMSDLAEAAVSLGDSNPHALGAAALQLFYLTLLLRQHCVALRAPQASMEMRRDAMVLLQAADILERQGHEVRMMAGDQDTVMDFARDLMVQARRGGLKVCDDASPPVEAGQAGKSVVQCGDLEIQLGPDSEGLDLTELRVADRGCEPHARFTLPDDALTPLIQALQILASQRRA